MDNIKNLKKAYEEGIYGSSFEIKLAKKSAQVLCNFLNKENVLELGIGFGYTTKEIAKVVKKLTIVDIEEEFFDKSINAKFIRSDWMEFETHEKYSDIILFRGLDYVKEPKKLLLKLKNFMDNNSRLHILVPNNNSLHRLVGFYAGIDSFYNLTENDKKVGHLHSFSLNDLRYLLSKTGFKIIHQEGIGLKPLSNSQMDKLEENIQNAFVEMGNLFIQNSAEVYLVCTL